MSVTQDSILSNGGVNE